MTYLSVKALICLELLREPEAELDSLASRLGLTKRVVEAKCCELRDTGLVDLQGPRVRALDKLSLALEAVSEGVSPETVARHLNWRDFERLCSKAFEMNEFTCTTGLRFKRLGRLREVDVLAARKPVLVAVDCKSWGIRRGKLSMLRRAIEQHLDRVGSLAAVLPELKAKLGLAEWSYAVLVPAIVTLFEESLYVHRGVPVVPVFKLNNFIQELPSYLDELATWRVKLSFLD
ncbi:MAG: hypothetical protein DRJ97_04625 [Thermoprotei archaeon]|nr:MAG: hypothetical protein DRJ97_04625 [Thermoprotei archaeon]